MVFIWLFNQAIPYGVYTVHSFPLFSVCCYSLPTLSTFLISSSHIFLGSAFSLSLKSATNLIIPLTVLAFVSILILPSLIKEPKYWKADTCSKISPGINTNFLLLLGYSLLLSKLLSCYSFLFLFPMCLKSVKMIFQIQLSVLQPHYCKNQPCYCGRPSIPNLNCPRLI